jgi:hypothetical protein
MRRYFLWLTTAWLSTAAAISDSIGAKSRTIFEEISLKFGK